MPDCQLIRFNTIPAGGIRITVVIHGKSVRIRLDSVEQAAEELRALRKNNGLERASYEECVTDLSISTCKELGCDPRWCTDGQNRRPAPATVKKSTGKGCGWCGRKKAR